MDITRYSYQYTIKLKETNNIAYDILYCQFQNKNRIKIVELYIHSLTYYNLQVPTQERYRPILYIEFAHQNQL